MYDSLCNLLISQENLKTNIFETNVAGMFATEKQRKILLKILELE